MMFIGVQDFACGAAFGSALYASGVFSPNVIIDQLRLRDMTMIKTFLAASGSSAIVFQLASSAGHVPKPTRSPRNLGYFPFDANILGGAMVGAGMAITGACPGTVLVQASVSSSLGTSILLGGLLGGCLYKPLWSVLNDSQTEQVKIDRLIVEVFNPWVTTLVWASTCISVIQATSLISSTPSSIAGLTAPAVGGLLIGLAQALTILVRKVPLGVSTAYEDLGQFFYSLSRGQRSLRSSKDLHTLFTPSVVFASGVLSGAWAMAQYWPGLAATSTSGLHVTQTQSPSSLAIAGGCIMVLGARIAGGCTSGHGISGMSAFSVASIVTTSSMFAVGVFTALLLW